MSDDKIQHENHPASAKLSGDPCGPQPPANTIFRFPALAAIGFYMLILAAVVITDVVTRLYQPVCLLFPVLFIAAGLGLLMLLRWAWALALAAVVMLIGLFLYQFTRTHAPSAIVQGLLNLVFFLYLVRTEVRQSLR
jgi:hypothetical protein